MTPRSARMPAETHAGSTRTPDRSAPPAPAPPSDEALVARVRSGDPEAFDALVVRHMERAFRLAHRLLGQREDAEDLVQEAFLLILERLDSYDPSRSFAPWFYRILVNRALNAQKARSVRRTEVIPESTSARNPSPASAAERSELREALRTALDALPEPQQMVVQLFEIDGFSGPEIADILDLPEGTVRWHLHQARRALREALAIHHEE